MSLTNPTQLQRENTTFTHVPYADAEVVYCRFSCDLQHHNSAAHAAATLILEDALLSGCAHLTREQFLHELNKLGATLVINVDNGIFEMTLECRTSVLKRVLRLIYDMLESPTFSDNELDRIKQLVRNTLIEYREHTGALARDGLVNSLYKPTDRRYHYESLLGATEIGSITDDTLRGLMQTLYGRNWTITVGGSAQVFEQVVHTFSRLHRSLADTHSAEAAPPTTHERRVPTKSLLTQSVASKQNIDFSIGAHIPITITDQAYLPLQVGLAILGKVGGFTGRLMSVIREKEGLTYGIYARSETVSAHEYGYWRIFTFFSPEQCATGLRATFRELRDWQRNGVTQDEVTRFQTILTTQHTLVFASLKRTVNAMHGYAVQGRSPHDFITLPSRLAAVTKATINESIYTHLQPKRVVISAAGPVQSRQRELVQLASELS